MRCGLEIENLGIKLGMGDFWCFGWGFEIHIREQGMVIGVLGSHFGIKIIIRIWDGVNKYSQLIQFGTFNE